AIPTTTDGDERMKTLVPVALALALTVASAPGAEKSDNKAPEGFTSLFNGKDLTGWQGALRIGQLLKMTPDDRPKAQEEVNDKVLPHWAVKGGVLENDGKGYNLGTSKDYRNFKLLVDWQIEPKGDSGIYLRGIPQVQIWDSDSLDPKRYAKDL